MYEREAPTYLPHPGHSYFYADNGGLLVFRQPPKRRSPRPLPKALIHECIRGGDTDAVRLCAGVGSINIGEYRYSSPLSGVFFFFFLFFSPMELPGPGPTLRCYWPPQTHSPAPDCVTWPPLISWLVLSVQARLRRVEAGGCAAVHVRVSRLRTSDKYCEDLRWLLRYFKC